MLSEGKLLALARWNTPTIYNGWEQVTGHDAAREGFNVEETCDFMPQMGPMVGYAVTVVCEPSRREHKERLPEAWDAYYRYIAAQPGPKVVVVQDLDKPRVIGSFWGEVTANSHRALGCVGTITDGAVRDIDEMTAAGFKAIARRLCVGHAHSWPVRWGEPVEVFGREVRPGQLIHADKHGFLVIPEGEEARLLEAAAFMDGLECRTVIPAARFASGLPADEVLARMEQARRDFGRAVREHFGREGEHGPGARK